jgi:cytochrome c oxidase subunit II
VIARFLPPAASEHAGRFDLMMDAVHWMMLALFVGWTAFFLYAVLRFRAGRNPVADHRGARTNAALWIAGFVALLELGLLAGMSIPLWAERVDHLPDESEATVVRVVAQQFAWNVWYPGADGVFGSQRLDLVDDADNPLGIDRNDPNGADDITTINQLYLPKGRPALLYLTSRDVIHSLSLPHMRIKQDAIPGVSTPVWFVPTRSTEEMRAATGNESFRFEIGCAQLCGNSHYSMRGFLTVYEPEEFEEWLAEEASYLEEGF